MNARIVTSIIIVSFSVFLIACDDDSGGGNGNRAAKAIDTSGVRQFAVGQDHACAVLKTGKVSCWGWNLYGQLGDGTTIDQNIPVEVDLEEGRTAVEIDVGYSHTCAILDDGSLQCWGNGDNGKLGNGSFTGRLRPIRVNLGENRTAVAIALGTIHTCAILDDNSLKCWGGNDRKQLGQGDSDTTDRFVPTEVNLGSDKKAVAVSAGSNHTCAILMDGLVKCWGFNILGQLGDGSNQERGAPTPVDLGSGRIAKAIGMGSGHTCALLDDNSVKCWGRNDLGQLGAGDNAHKNVPTAVNLGDGRSATAISVGSNHSCALLDDNSVKCWGRNDFGQLGDETTLHKNTPTSVDTGTGTIAAIGVGGNSSCALFADGSLACWGSNAGGQLGTGEDAFVVSPQTIDNGGHTITAIDGGIGHTCGRDPDQLVKLRCWGLNDSGQIGNGTKRNSLVAFGVAVVQGSFVSAFSTGSDHTCAILNNNKLNCWGKNGAGQLGIGSDVDTVIPTEVGLGTGKTAKAVSAGVTHTCAILNDNKVKCWGEGSKGQLGNGTNNDSTSPVSVTMTSNTADKISAGFEHTCAILDDDKVYCWGEGGSGQLGRGSTTDSNTPVAVTLDSARTATDIRVGSGHSCALLDDKSVVCWGENTSGQLGDRSTSNRTTPVSVPLGSGRTATAIHAKGFQTCAILDDGSLLCWGRNHRGQLGDGTTAHRNTPVAVDLGEGRTATAVGGGVNHTCAILDDESVVCWGDNYFGQAGVSTSHRGDQAGEMGEKLKFVKFEQEKEKPLPQITLAMGDGHMCAIDEDGALACWGLNNNSQLGVTGNQACIGPDNVNRNCIVTPKRVDLGQGISVVALSALYYQTCAILDDDSLKCWGFDNNGVLGDGGPIVTGTPVRVRLEASRTAVAVSTGYDHSCALLNNGSVQCWGGNSRGELGNASNGPSVIPVVVNLGSEQSAVSISSGDNHNCAILEGNSIACWGSNIWGELGVNDNTSRNVPAGVTLADGKTALAVRLGARHTCAILNDNSLVCWGSNGEGQLGVGSSSNEVCTISGTNYDCIKTPAQVDLGTNRTAKGIGLGERHTCAILDNGSVKCWGQNTHGQLGDGTNTDRNSPVEVELPKGRSAKIIHARGKNTCVILDDNSIVCWGGNHFGQLLDGTTIDRYRPVRARFD